MAIASGKDVNGTTWIALYCVGCSARVSGENIDVHELRLRHGWQGEHCPDCLERQDSHLAVLA